MKYSPQQKLYIASKINEKKDILFASFSSAVTSEAKAEAWKAIFEDCLSRGVPFPAEKDFTYMRDTLWPNMKNSVVVCGFIMISIP